MDKTKPRNFRTTDQTDKVDDFFFKKVLSMDLDNLDGPNHFKKYLDMGSDRLQQF